MHGRLAMIGRAGAALMDFGKNGSEGARPLLALGSRADPLLALCALSPGSHAIRTGFSRALTFLAVSLHTRAVRSHALTNWLLS